MLQHLKAQLKRVNWAVRLNRLVKSRRTEARYRKWCRRYASPCILEASDDSWARSFAGALRPPPGPVAGPPRRFFFAGTSWDQDHSGLVQGLRAHGEVAVLAGPDGRNELRLPRQASETTLCREANGRALLAEFEAFRARGPVSALIGQMWNFAVPVEVLHRIRQAGVPVVNLAMDDRHSFHQAALADGTDGGVAGLVPAITLSATAAPECVRWYEQLGARAVFLPEASDASLFRPMALPKAHDITFVGANYGFRADIVAALRAAGLRVTTYGSGWAEGRIVTKAIPELFARSRIVLGVGAVLHCTGFTALKLRDFDAPMSGSFYLTQASPDLGLVFRVGEEVEVWRDIPELVAKCRHYLADDVARERIASAGRLRAVREHTWADRFGGLLQQLDALAAEAPRPSPAA